MRGKQKSFMLKISMLNITSLWLYQPVTSWLNISLGLPENSDVFPTDCYIHNRLISNSELFKIKYVLSSFTTKKNKIKCLMERWGLFTFFWEAGTFTVGLWKVPMFFFLGHWNAPGLLLENHICLIVEITFNFCFKFSWWRHHFSSSF